MRARHEPDDDANCDNIVNRSTPGKPPKTVVYGKILSHGRRASECPEQLVSTKSEARAATDFRR
jgi:hypothetical protein